MSDTLKFGPQWLRNLSDGGNVTSPPPSPAPLLNKYKLAEHRYGREEMLALYDPGKGMPPDLQEVPFIAKEKSQKPLAIVPFSDEEMLLMSQSVNSTAVLRMTGRGGPPPPGVTRGGMRGGGSDRGRGRGRGRGDGYHSRGPYEEDSYGRGRYTRGESWDEGGRGFERGSRGFGGRETFDDGGPQVSPRREFSRSMSSDNWRDNKDGGLGVPPGSAGDDEAGNDWRRAGPTRDKWGGRTWREQREPRGGFDSDRGDRRGFDDYHRPPFDKDKPAFRRSRSSGSYDDEGDAVPEWSTSDAGEMDGLGTFDSSGAFINVKEPWKEVGDKDREGENWEDDIAKTPVSPPDNKGDSKRAKESQSINSTDNSDTKSADTEKNNNKVKDEKQSSVEMTKRPSRLSQEKKPRTGSQPADNTNSQLGGVSSKSRGKTKTDSMTDHARETKTNVHSDRNILSDNAKTGQGRELDCKPSSSPADKPSPGKTFSDITEEKTVAKSEAVTVVPASVSNQARAEEVLVSGRTKKSVEEEEGDFGHLERAAEDLVADLSAEETEAVEKASANSRSAETAEGANKWFYRDPQGDVQGPFTSSEMAEWFSAGYFTMNLHVKRGCDDSFQPLGELIKRWGKVPFLAARNSPTPLQSAHGTVASSSGNVPSSSGVPVAGTLPAASITPTLLNPASSIMAAQPSETAGNEDQMKAMLHQAAAVQQQQFMQQQALLRQMQLQQIVHNMQQQEAFAKLDPQQQQTLAIQLLIKQQQHTALLQSSAIGGNPLSSASNAAVPLLPTSVPQVPQGAVSTQPKPAVRTSEDAAARTAGWPAQTATSDSWKQPASIWDMDGRGKPAESKHDAEVKDHLELERQEFERQREAREAAERKRQAEIEERQRELEQQAERERQQELERQRELRRQKEERMREIERQQEMERQKEAERLKELELERQRELERRQEMERQRLMEQEAIRREEERRIEEERRKLEEKKRLEEERQRLEEEKRRAEEERKRKEEEERLRLQEEQRQEEIRRRQEKADELRRQQQQEALRRMQRQQMANMQLPSTAQWGNAAASGANAKQGNLSLAEIQAIEADKERKQLEEREKLERQRLQIELEQQQQQQRLSWTSSAAAPGRSASKTGPSLLDIQQEQERQLRDEKTRKQSTKVDVPLASATVWGSGVPGANWASEGTWGSKSNSLAGFWEEPQRPAKKQPSNGTNSHFPALNPAGGNNQAGGGKVRSSKSKKEEETVQRLFNKSLKPQDEFTKWCETALHELQTTVDIPTFVAFLKDVDSPYEVHEYVRSYLEDSSEATQFATQFIDRRSKYKNQLKQPKEEVMSGPAPAVNPFQQQQQQHRNNNNDNIGSSASGEDAKSKKKKKKMQKMDPSILGFSVHAAPDRVNIGQIDTGNSA